ncbi:MAG: RNA polymerase sigma factor [Candidatus Hydrogenedentes bacterium]|nr:RNA polymerase sigma factor [Candidatus Hydrogenedentota bacterium]
MRSTTATDERTDSSRAHEFLEHVEKYRHEFYRFAARTLWNPQMTDDVFQSAVLSGFENYHNFTPGTNFRAWMYRILVNKCYVANREAGRAAKPLDEVDPHVLCVRERPEYADVLDDPTGFLEHCGDEVILAFKRLSPAERSCILLRSSDGLSYQEIGDILRMPVGTVMTHLSRGRAKLRTDLIDYAKRCGIIAERRQSRRARSTELPSAAMP